MTDQHEAYRQYQGALWMCHDDTVRMLLPHLTWEGVRNLVEDLRPDQGGRWMGMPEPFESQRRLLLDAVARRGAEVARNGEELLGFWPFPDDLLEGQVPDDLSGMGGGNV